NGMPRFSSSPPPVPRGRREEPMSREGQENNPQFEEMSDASMVRTLAHQASAIWPQELPIVRGYGLSGRLAILDVGCGTGEISTRLAELFPEASVVGVDLIETHLELGRARAAHLRDRVRFERADAFALPFGDGAFDLVVC